MPPCHVAHPFPPSHVECKFTLGCRSNGADFSPHPNPDFFVWDPPSRSFLLTFFPPINIFFNTRRYIYIYYKQNQTYCREKPRVKISQRRNKMEETRKREREQNFNQNDDVSSAALKRPRATLEDGGDGGGDLGDDIMAWLSMDDDTMSQLMNLLDTSPPNADSATARTTRVKFIDNPYKSLVIFQSSSSYVTINGNEESCGSSFSDSESSVMVSVDTAGIVKSFPTRGSQRDCEVSAWSSNEEEKEVGGFGFFEGGGGEIMDGCDGSDLDDYVLPKFLVQEQEEARAPF